MEKPKRCAGALPPPPVCGRTRHAEVMKGLGAIRFNVFVGRHAISYHLGRRDSVAAVVADWRNLGRASIALPHPSWRNTTWIKRNPWFETEVLPVLRASVREALDDR